MTNSFLKLAGLIRIISLLRKIINAIKLYISLTENRNRRKRN